MNIETVLLNNDKYIFVFGLFRNVMLFPFYLELHTVLVLSCTFEKLNIFV